MNNPRCKQDIPPVLQGTLCWGNDPAGQNHIDGVSVQRTIAVNLKRGDTVRQGNYLRLSHNEKYFQPVRLFKEINSKLIG